MGGDRSGGRFDHRRRRAAPATSGITGIGGGGGTVDPTVAACMASNGALNAGLDAGPPPDARSVQQHGPRSDRRDRHARRRARRPTRRSARSTATRSRPSTTRWCSSTQEMAASLAVAAKARMAQIAPCDLTTDTGTSTTCATRFVTEFGKRAYRRPLDATEIAPTSRSTRWASRAPTRPTASAWSSRRCCSRRSSFITTTSARTGTPQAGTVAITPYELASRLSYFLWNTMPDDTLFARAADGTLATDAVLTGEVQRMLASDKAAGDDRALPPPVARRHASCSTRRRTRPSTRVTTPRSATR